MTKHELKQLIASKLSSQLIPYGYAIATKSTVKANDQLVESIVVSNDEKIAQMIDVDWTYQEYYYGASINEIVNRIVHKVISGSPIEIKEIAEMIFDFSLIKDRIFASVVNTRLNTSWLRDKPHYDIEDLSIIYHIVVNQDGRDSVTRVPITDTMFETWRVEAATLHNMAMNNTYNYDPAILLPMVQKLKELTNDEFDFSHHGDSDSLMLISNKTWLFGAIHMFNTDALRSTSRLLMTNNLYILPSSVHEVIVCPANVMTIEYANNMVSEVNKTIDPKDVLSNHIYLYNKDTNRINAV